MLREVTVENGKVRGIPAADPRITAFKGVPFAAPPVGALRWRVPQPAKDWEGVLQAYKFAPISMQRVPGTTDDIYTKEWNVDPDIPMSEDCLYLNVWTPAKRADEKLPVYVWYFGGGLQVGNTAEMEFDGERIARRGIVVVTVNYRLNVFGFLAHPEITAENPEFPANFGNLDQKFGTEWVKRNIGAFGGDPENITIGGQSAGGGSVLTQLTSPLTGGLFQKAIIESGIMHGAYVEPFPMKVKSLEAAEKAGEEFFEFLGVKTLAQARELSAEYVRDKSLEYDRVWATAIDGNYIVGNFIELLLKNKRHMVPLMMGRTTDEFTAVPPIGSAEEFEELAKEKFGGKAHKFIELCKSGDLEEVKAKASFSPIELGVRALFEKTEEAEDAPDNYYYVFDPQIPGPDNPGTFHSVDLWFFFETLSLCWRPFTGKHYDLARNMCNYWANFIKTGDPNGKDADGSGMPEWKPYAASECPMVFGDFPKMDADGGKSELMEFLVDYYLSK